MTPFLRISICLPVILFLLGTSLPASATMLVWPDYPNGRLYRIDVEKKILEAETQPNVWVILGVVQMEKVIADAFPPVTRVTCLGTDNSRFRYLLVDCTQQVYRFDNQTHTLERLDKTFFRGYNCYSAKFLRRDTLYSFGGYGFWHTNNIQSYYKAANHEWESMNPSADAPSAINRGFNGYLADNDTFFSALSLYQNDSENQGAFTWSDSVYAYSFTRKTWQRLGQLTAPFKQHLRNDLIEKASWFQVGKYFVLNYYDAPQAVLIIVDPIRNEVRIWRDTHKTLANPGNAVENNIQRNYIWRNNLYFRRDVTGATGKTVYTTRLSIDVLWQEGTALGAFYEPVSARSTLWLCGLAGAFLIVGTGIAFWNSRYRKSTGSTISTVDEQPLRFDQAYPDSLNGQERGVFSALLNTGDADGLNTEQLNDLLLISDKSPDNQRKIRADVIKALNLKLQLQWGINEAIERKATTVDRRMFTYMLNPEVKDRARINEVRHRENREEAT